MPSNILANEENIMAIKADTIQLRKQITALKTKIKMTKTKVENRNRAISNVFTQAKKDQKLATVNKNKIEYLKKQIENMTNTKESRQQELENIKTNDRYFLAGELQNDILVLYQEQKRLLQNSDDDQTKKNEMGGRIFIIGNKIRSSQNYIEGIDEIEREIAELNEKNDTYKRGQAKVFESDVLYRVDNDFSVFDEEKQKLETENEELQKQLDALLEENKTIEDENTKTEEELDAIIAEARQKIIDSMNKNEEEEEENKEEQKEDEKEEEKDNKEEHEEEQKEEEKEAELPTEEAQEEKKEDEPEKIENKEEKKSDDDFVE